MSLRKLLLLSLLFLTPSFSFSWTEVNGLRTKNTKVYADEINSSKKLIEGRLIQIHYDNGEGGLDEIDMTPSHITSGGNDVWMVSGNEWHYAVGQPADKSTDGWVGFGGKKGQHWFESRLFRVGYLRWSDKLYTDVGGTPNYQRPNLSQDIDEISVGPSSSTLNLGLFASWTDIWNVSTGGAIDIEWQASGGALKERIVLNQEGRDYAATQYPGGPMSARYFGYIFDLDFSDIPRVLLDNVLQVIDTDVDFNDSTGTLNIQFQNASEELLAFLPISDAWVEDDEGNEIPGSRIRLRKRIFYDAGSSKYLLLLGARVDQLNSLPDGNLVFDPTIDSQVASGDADAHETDGGTNFSATANPVVLHANATSTSRFNGGFYYPSITIPQGSTIDVAYITVEPANSSVDDPNVDISLEDVDDAVDFATDADVTSRTRTTASVQWTASGIGTSPVNSPSIVSPVQEVIDRVLWSSGNALVVLVDGRSDSSAQLRIDSYEKSSGAEAVILHIEYTEPVVSESTLQRLIILTH